MIQDIEELGAKLNLDELVDGAGFEDGKIDGLIARAEYLVSARGALELAGGTLDKGCGIDPESARYVGIWVADLHGTLVAFPGARVVVGTQIENGCPL